MHEQSIYVEILIRASLDELWARTQDPELHGRWDLRFTRIEYVPRPDPVAPQSFLYATRIGFGIEVRGEGESLGARDGEGGARSSALRFWSRDRKSLIEEGSGYWKYVPAGDGTVRFLTRYDYRTRFGVVGRLVDRVLFRPLLGWATAWSFDRLRLWLEDGIDPRTSGERALAHALARGTLGILWLHQGLVPKVLFPASGELAIVRDSGIFTGKEELVLAGLGIIEMLFGLVILTTRWRWPLVANLVLLPLLAAGAALASPALFAAPFGPAPLTFAMLALALLALISGRGIPSARRCRRVVPRAATEGSR